MKYVDYINSILKQIVKKEENLVLYGQNINAASCLSGLTRDLGNLNKSMTINTPNSENTLVGIGFGLMLSQTSSIFFMKQLDFLLLGIDHLVNTYNIIRERCLNASFTIFPVTVDSGYEGPQSALNNIDDLASISDVQAFSFTNKIDTDKILNKKLVCPGFRILSPSQDLLKNELIDIPVLYHDEDLNFFKYFHGNDLTIICFNFALKYGIECYNIFKFNHIHSSLFSINSHLPFDYRSIVKDLNKTKRLLVIDDSKSINKHSNSFLQKVYLEFNLERKFIVMRDREINRFYPNNDELNLDYHSLVNYFRRK